MPNYYNYQQKADQKINVTIPLNFLNEDIAPGVKVDGGIISRLMNEIEIVCLPANIPENIPVDLIDLEIDQPIHLSELKLPDGVEMTSLQSEDDNDPAVVVIHKAKAVVEEEPVDAPEASEVASDQKNDENKDADKASDDKEAKDKE